LLSHTEEERLFFPFHHFKVVRSSAAVAFWHRFLVRLGVEVLAPLDDVLEQVLLHLSVELVLGL
jgi:hypothetical protein